MMSRMKRVYERVMSPVHIRIPLRAAPQGSKRHVGGGRLIEMAGDALKAYRAALGYEARRQMQDRELITKPVGVSATFVFRRPKSHSTSKGLRETAPTCCYPAKRGDVDKLLRATLDALTGTVYKDDAQVVTVNASVIWGDEDETHVLVHPLDDVVDMWCAGLGGIAA
jgi:crossover junction endodeoxyribonuclease RusA